MCTAAQLPRKMGRMRMGKRTCLCPKCVLGQCTPPSRQFDDIGGGPCRAALALALNDLAELYKEEARYADTEPLYKRALAIREKAIGPDHPDV